MSKINASGASTVRRRWVRRAKLSSSPGRVIRSQPSTSGRPWKARMAMPRAWSAVQTLRASAKRAKTKLPCDGRTSAPRSVSIWVSSPRCRRITAIRSDPGPSPSASMSGRQSLRWRRHRKREADPTHPVDHPRVAEGVADPETGGAPRLGEGADDDRVRIFESHRREVVLGIAEVHVGLVEEDEGAGQGLEETAEGVARGDRAGGVVGADDTDQRCGVAGPSRTSSSG